jgi:phosphoribosylformimino-5-aminoimidazole carboxamide ribotide isomerase
VLVIPAIDLEGGRSRVVYWPGAAAGIGTPTDRPDRIAERFVEQGARMLHLVDFDGARRGSPGNLGAIGQIAGRVAVPLQVAGGLEGGDQIRLAFAAGATRAVVAMSVVEQPDVLRACIAVAGDWLAVGLDPRTDRFAAFPWRRPTPPSLSDVVSELVGLGVGRFVLTHAGGEAEVARLAGLVRAVDAEFLVAGGVRDVAALGRLRDAGVAGVILGEALLSGAMDYRTAAEAAA